MSGGVGEALKAALDGFEPEEEADQPVLFGDDLGSDQTGALDAPSPMSALFTPKGRAGRKPGSRNRRTEAVTAWLLSQARHPVLVMMEAYSMSPAQLAARIGLRMGYMLTDGDGNESWIEGNHYSNETLLDVFKLQMAMADKAAPYVAQRLPQAIQLDAKAGVTLSFEGVSLPARREAGAAAEGQLALRLPSMSDDQSRTDD